MGAAKCVAESAPLAMTAAALAGVGNDPPTSSFQLTIIAKNKQKAFN